MVLRVGLIALLLSVLAPHQALSWGSAGHSIVAELAQRRLHPDVQKQVKLLLGGNASLASVANWADTVALVRPETRGWHFVNIPVGADRYDAARDCRPTNGDCIVNAITQMRKVLADRYAPRPKRAEALKFLVHLIADIHQPLHCANRNDAGGSQLMVMFFDKPMSLHAVWDVGLIERRNYDWGEMVDVIERDQLKARGVEKLVSMDPAEWAWTAHQIAREVAYAMPEDLRLGEDYLQRSYPLVERQLALAGVRLAQLLNTALRPIR
jgi:S1/P1 Nuclease